jgi:branched-chain amino acid transport system permease protein
LRQTSLTNVLARPLAALVIAGIVFYLAWLPAQSGVKFAQFTVNGAIVGAIYALVALGFTLIYTTVWFFDISFGAMAIIGPYTVFYFTAREAQLVGRGDINNLGLNVFFGVVVAAVVAWVLATWLYPRVRARLRRQVALPAGAVIAAGAGVYTTLMLSRPGELNLFMAPLVGLSILGLAWLLASAVLRPRVEAGGGGSAVVTVALVVGAAVAAICGFLLARNDDSILYLSWVAGSLLAGAASLALYRGLYYYMRRRARSPLIMLVGSLGVLLTIQAFISIIFSPDARPVAAPFGSTPWLIGGEVSLKPFQVFVIGSVLVIFLACWLLMTRTSFGKALRAIGDDEEVSKVVGINTTVNIAAVFFLGAAIAALAGIFLGSDTGAMRPTVGLTLLLKGWVASVVGGIGTLQGALLGGFMLGLIENYGVWYINSEWKDAIAFVLLIFFLSFKPLGFLPRK